MGTAPWGSMPREGMADMLSPSMPGREGGMPYAPGWKGMLYGIWPGSSIP